MRQMVEGRLAFLLAALLIVALCVLLPPRALGGDDPPADDTLMESGRAARLAAAPAAPAEFKVVSYNIRYREGEELQELIRLLKEDAEIGGAAVIGLQEVDRNKRRTRNANTARQLAEALGMHYVWAAPPPPRPKEGVKAAAPAEEETGVALLSPYPMRDLARLVLAHEGPNRRRRAAVGATVQIGGEDVRVYSVHAETRMPVELKVEHWRVVLEDLQKYAGVRRVVVVGDFNTVKPKDVRAARQLFTGAGFATPFPDDEETFKVFMFDYKLDWVWLRGLAPVAHGIDRKVSLSDHWPLWVTVRLDKQNDKQAPAADAGATQPRSGERIQPRSGGIM